MADPKQIKAYIPDASGQLIPFTGDSLVLEFPSGDYMEISWETQHPDDPRPACLAVWGGRRVSKPLSEGEVNALTRTTSVALLPSASNVVLVHPYSYPIRKHA
jgi:hypothetical protein